MLITTMKNAQYKNSSSVSFSGRTGVDFHCNHPLIQDTAFFREPDTDEFVKKYVKENFGDKKNINIVCGGCSSGEEAYTLAMHFDDMKNKVKILGFDLSESAIKDAKNGVYYIQNPASRNLNKEKLPGAYADSFLAYTADKNLTDKQIQYKSLFYKYFNELDLHLPDSSVVPQKIFTANDKISQNCTFAPGNIMHLDEILNDNSTDVFYFRNAIYHLVTDFEKENQNADKIKKQIYSGIYDKLSPNGILVFGEHEQAQNINLEKTSKILKEIGFEPVYPDKTNNKSNNNQKISNIWKKVK